MQTFLATLFLIAGSADRDSSATLALPAVVIQSDVIISATCISAPSVESHHRILPGLDQSGFFLPPHLRPHEQARLSSYTVRVDRVFRDATGTLKPAEQLIVRTRTRPDSDTLVRALAPGGIVFPEPEQGQRYLLMLMAFEEFNEFFLPSNQHAFMAQDQIIEQIGTNYATVLDPDRWDWSKPAKQGLQIALLVSDSVSQLKDGVRVSCMTALRNVSDKPFHIMLHPFFQPLKIRTQSPGSNSNATRVAIYDPEASLDPRGALPYTLYPERMVFIGTRGPVVRWFPLPIAPDLDIEGYKLSASYVFRGLPNLDLGNWTGRVDSATTMINGPPAEPSSTP